MSIRQSLGEEDLDRVQEIVRNARLAGELWAHSWPAHQIHNESKAAELWLMIEKSDSAFAPDMTPGSVIGFCFLRPPGPCWEITLVATDPVARRRGAFRHLIESLRSGVLEDQKRSALSVVFALEVRDGNLAAQKAYESIGFVARGRRKAYYHDGQDAIIYELG